MIPWHSFRLLCTSTFSLLHDAKDNHSAYTTNLTYQYGLVLLHLRERKRRGWRMPGQPSMLQLHPSLLLQLRSGRVCPKGSSATYYSAGLQANNERRGKERGE